MNRTRMLSSGLILAMLSANGCARLVTAEPGEVQSLNAPGWKIRPSKPEPKVSPATVAAPPERTADNDAIVPFPPAGAATAVASAPAASPTPVSAPPVNGAVLARALQSPPDEYGIARDMYRQDPMLLMHRQVMEETVHSHHVLGGGAIAMGVVEAGLAALLFWRAGVNSDAARAARDNGQSVTSDPSAMQYFWGGLSGLLSIGFLGYGIAQVATSQDPSVMKAYYQESYGAPPR